MNVVITNKWTKDEYLALVLIYGAMADYGINDDEETWIKEEVGNATYNKMMKSIAKLSDHEMIEMISDNRSAYFPGQAGKSEIMEKLEELFEADDDYSRLEHVIFNTIVSML